MFVYHYRLFDRSDCPVASLVLLTGPFPAWRPSAYRCEFAGCTSGLTFPVAKLLDFAGQPGLAEAENVFGLVTAAHLAPELDRRFKRSKVDMEGTWQLAMKFGPLAEEVLSA